MNATKTLPPVVCGALVRPLRAKVIAAYFNESPTIERLREVAIAFHQEAAALLKSRNVKTEGAMLAVLREQDLKWRAFARICDEVRPTAFQAVTHELVPETRTLWPNVSDQATASARRC